MYYAGREELERAIIQKFWTEIEPEQTEKDRLPQREWSGQRDSHDWPTGLNSESSPTSQLTMRCSVLSPRFYFTRKVIVCLHSFIFICADSKAGGMVISMSHLIRPF